MRFVSFALYSIRRLSRCAESQPSLERLVMNRAALGWTLFLAHFCLCPLNLAAASAPTARAPKKGAALPKAGSSVSTAVSPKDVTSYELSAYLDAEAHVVQGRGRILFVNPSDEPAHELYFHLYLNAFEGKESLYLRDKGGRSGVLRGETGRIRVSSLTSERYGPRNLWEDASPHTPGDPNDRTDIMLPLPEPLLGHETLVLNIEFESRLPEIVERTGYFGDFHLVAQWFPKLAKREADGTWAHFPFHPFAEFYADFGSYDIELDVPQGFVVGSTGRLSELSGAQPGRKRYLARAEHVHDFAWTAWPHFRVDERVLDGVSIRVLTPPGREFTNLITWETLEQGLPFLGSAFGAYPYADLTVVYPPRGAHRAGGMEYPQFITTGGGTLAQWLGLRALEQTTIHELVHQWFQGFVASNEAAHPFLDEGLTTHAEWLYLDSLHGPCSMVDLPGVCLSRAALGRYSVFYREQDQPVNLPAAAFKTFSRLAALVYDRTALSLATVGAAFGPDRLAEGLRDYAETFRFAHPTPEDFYSKMAEHIGPPAGRQLEIMLEEKVDFDLSVAAVETQPTKEEYLTRVTVLKHGNLWLPFETAARLEDGTVLRLKRVDDQANYHFQFSHASPLVSVEVDPEHRLLLDSNLLNNRVALRAGRPRLAAFWGTLFAFLASWITS